MSNVFDHIPYGLRPLDIDVDNVSDEQLAEVVEFETRFVRDLLLKESDFRVVADSPWDTAPWVAYRQALRDLPSDPAWPNVEFPSAPE